MTRFSITAAIAVAVLVGAAPGCSSQGEPARSVVPTSAPAPGAGWLAVLASAADPSALDAPREDLVRALGTEGASSVLVSPGGCFTDIPERYGPLYVLAVTDTTRSGLVDRLGAAATDAEWIGVVTSTCLD
jgi:hypothetical protein